MKRMRCSRCGKLIPESRLQEHPKAAKVREGQERMKDCNYAHGRWKSFEFAAEWTNPYDGLFHISHQLFGASGGRIGARTQRVYCGPVQEEVIDPYQDQLEHFLGVKF